MNEIEIKILKELSKGISLTRNTLAIKVGLPRTTIFDNLSKLREKEYVFSFKKYTHTKGRPKVYWYIPVKLLQTIKNKNFFNSEVK